VYSDPEAAVSADAAALLIDNVPQFLAPRLGKPLAEPFSVRITTTDPARDYLLTSGESVALTDWPGDAAAASDGTDVPHVPHVPHVRRRAAAPPPRLRCFPSRGPQQTGRLMNPAAELLVGERLPAPGHRHAAAKAFQAGVHRVPDAQARAHARASSSSR
jgi:hypothetical protein